MGEKHQLQPEPKERQPEPERPSGLEQASNLLVEQMLNGRVHLRPLATPILQDLGQLPPLSIKDDDKKRELKVETNAYTLNTSLDYHDPDLTITGRFSPAAGWNRPFGRPSYNLSAETTDKSTLFRVSATDGAAPAIRFEHNRYGLGLLYNRDVQGNAFGVTAGSDPIKFGLGHDFRRQHTTLGLSGQILPYSTFGVGASIGRKDYDLNFFLKIGEK